MITSPSVAAAVETAVGFGKSIARDIELRLDEQRYHFDHAAEAGRAYATICASDPGRRLDRRTERRIRGYAREVLGSRHYAPWLRVLSAWAGEFREGWIPDNYYGRVIHGHSHGLSRHKTLARRLFDTDLLPDLAYHVGGTWFGLDGARLEAAEIDDVVFSDEPRVVVKYDGSLQGLGVHVLERGKDSLGAHTGRGNFVVQRFIRQAPFFDRFLPDNVAAMRITTVRTPERPAQARARYLKFGRAGQRSYTSEGGVRAPILDGDGRVGEVGAMSDWTPVTRHPDSGEAFAGKVVPRFAEACRAVEALHRRLPHAEIIGWDVVIDDEGRIQVMEWNGGHSDIMFSEATIGPCFRGLGWENRWRR